MPVELAEHQSSIHGYYEDAPCTHEMAAPVRPPTPETVRAAALPARLKAPPAELVTLDSPCCALLATCDALSFALLALEETASVAASVVDDAARLWRTHRDCRIASRGRKIEDMITRVVRSQCCFNGQLL